MGDGNLASFIEDVCGEGHLRVETDLGGGFVRLRSSEAERRQAAQDIRSSEDIIIEMLRNAPKPAIFPGSRRRSSAVLIR